MQSVGSGLGGSIVVSIFQAMRFGIARGCFTNEAGMGSAAIAAAAAASDEPVKQGYVNMTSVFWDTIVICSITGLCIASSGMLGQIDPATGELYTGVALTMAAFSTVLGKLGTWGICICIALFAFATILGWEYYGEKAFEYLVGTYRYNTLYRIIFSFIVFIGCTTTLQIAWDFSDIANAFMCIPNLLCLLYLRKEIVKDICDYQVILNKDLERR
jgi:AGCS family alanine or glycine:cation symporter